jgi:hypothetical protein
VKVMVAEHGLPVLGVPYGTLGGLGVLRGQEKRGGYTPRESSPWTLRLRLHSTPEASVGIMARSTVPALCKKTAQRQSCAGNAL